MGSVTSVGCGVGIAAAAAAAANSFAGKGREATPSLPVVDSSAPVVTVYWQASPGHGEERRIALEQDCLLLARQPGPADESVLLTGAEVSVQGNVVQLLPRLAPSLTLLLDTPEEAQRWADRLHFGQTQAAKPADAADAAGATDSANDEKLRIVDESLPEQTSRIHELEAAKPADAADAAGATDSANDEKLRIVDESLPEQTSRIHELEARVSASLRAAYERSARIKELEDNVEEGKEREERIKQLEEVLHETLEEAEARAERIEELEWELKCRGGECDPVAAAMLEDAMAFADELLRGKEELVVDDNSALQLREAVEAVQKAKPQVDAQVATLIKQLVTALRWPVVLRERLADAEESVKENEELQEQALQAIIDLQTKCDSYEIREDERQVADEEASRTKQLKDVAHEEEMRLLQQRQAATEAARVDAEAKAKELRDLLDFADEAADEAVARQRAELEKAHAEELRGLRHLADMADVQQKEAQAKSAQLQQELKAAEAAIDEKSQKQRAQLSAEHELEVQSLRRQFAAAEEQRDTADTHARELRERLEETSGSAEELAKLRGALEAQSADLELLQQRDQQDDAYREELQELRRNSEATEVRHREAEEQLRELRALLASSQQNSKAVLTAKTTDLEAKHSAEVRGLQSRVAAAEVQEQLAEAKAQQLKDFFKDRLVADSQAADEAKISRLANSAYEQELETVRQKHKEAESKQQAAEARAVELGQKLADAEKAASEAAQKQIDELDATREDELRSVRQQMEVAEIRMNKVESKASEIRQKLVAAEVSMGEEAQRKQRVLMSEHHSARTASSSPGPRGRRPGGRAPPTAVLDDREAARWMATADEATERLKQFEAENTGSGFDLKRASTTVTPQQFEDKKKELESRLAAAEKALAGMQEVPDDISDA